MSSTDAMRMRQKTQRLEIPDKPVSTSTLESVEAACRKFLAERRHDIQVDGLRHEAGKEVKFLAVGAVHAGKR